MDFPLLFVVKQNFINGIMEKHVESVELLETLLTFACAAEKFGERESNACLILLKSLLSAIIYSVKCWFKNAAWHEHKQLSMSRVNAPRLPSNLFWQVELVAHRFYCLEASPMGSSLEMFPMLLKRKKHELGSLNEFSSGVKIILVFD